MRSVLAFQTQTHGVYSTFPGIGLSKEFKERPDGEVFVGHGASEADALEEAMDKATQRDWDINRCPEILEEKEQADTEPEEACVCFAREVWMYVSLWLR